MLRMACGLQDLMRDGEGEERETLEQIQEFLDDFYQVGTCIYIRVRLAWSKPRLYHVLHVESGGAPLYPSVPVI